MVKKEFAASLRQENRIGGKYWQLLPTFTFTNLPHYRTCHSAYSGFGLSHLTMCDKLFSAIPLNNVTSVLLSDSVPSCKQRVPFGHLTTKDSLGSSLILLHCPIQPFPIGRFVWQSHPRLYALYEFSVRWIICLPTTSFRFHLTMDTLPWAIAFPLLGWLGDLHPLDDAHTERTKIPRTCVTDSGASFTQ